MRGLERLQAVHPRVVLGVGQFGRIEDVVEVFVVANVFAQRFDLLVGREMGRHGRNYRERLRPQSKFLNAGMHQGWLRTRRYTLTGWNRLPTC